MVGYYGDNGDKLLSEDAKKGDDYFSQILLSLDPVLAKIAKERCALEKY